MICSKLNDTTAMYEVARKSSRTNRPRYKYPNVSRGGKVDHRQDWQDLRPIPLQATMQTDLKGEARCGGSLLSFPPYYIRQTLGADGAGQGLTLFRVWLRLGVEEMRPRFWRMSRSSSPPCCFLLGLSARGETDMYARSDSRCGMLAQEALEWFAGSSDPP